MQKRSLIVLILILTFGLMTNVKASDDLPKIYYDHTLKKLVSNSDIFSYYQSMAYPTETGGFRVFERDITVNLTKNERFVMDLSFDMTRGDATPNFKILLDDATALWLGTWSSDGSFYYYYSGGGFTNLSSTDKIDVHIEYYPENQVMDLDINNLNVHAVIPASGKLTKISLGASTSNFVSYNDFSLEIGESSSLIKPVPGELDDPYNLFFNRDYHPSQYILGDDNQIFDNGLDYLYSLPQMQYCIFGQHVDSYDENYNRYNVMCFDKPVKFDNGLPAYNESFSYVDYQFYQGKWYQEQRGGNKYILLSSYYGTPRFYYSDNHFLTKISNFYASNYPLKYYGSDEDIPMEYGVFDGVNVKPKTTTFVFDSVDKLQSYSFDTYISKEYNLSEFDFTFDFENKSTKKVSLNRYYFYGLINENGLYHWEEIPINEAYIDNDTIKETDTGFTITATAKFPNAFSKYEKVKMSILVNNAFDYQIKMKVPKVFASFDFFDNFIFHNYFRLIHNTANYRYLIFTTKENYLNENIYVKGVENNLFMDIFSTDNKLFKEYELWNNFLYNSDWKYNNYEIGLENAKGFYLLSNKNAEVSATVLFSDKLYYSFNDDDLLTNSIFIDNNGDIYQGDIIPTDDEDNHNYSLNTWINALKKILVENNAVFHSFFDLFNVLFKGLNASLQALLLSLFFFALAAVIIRNVWWFYEWIF